MTLEAIIRTIHERGGAATRQEINDTVPYAAQKLRRLVKQGYVEIDKHGLIRLTERGQRLTP